MATWEQVRQLQADFQETQLSSSKQKLSERNVVEIVNTLIELKLVDLNYTLDGKEYVTPQQIVKEIKDELFVHGGRINLVDLQQMLNIDLTHIEKTVSDLVRHEKSLILVLGQLIDRSYIDKLAEEVNDKLQEEGQVSFTVLTKEYNLPAEFLREKLSDYIGRVIKAQVDSYDNDVLYTDEFVARVRAKVKGAFSAVTRPVQISVIQNRLNLPHRLLFDVLDELISAKRIAGSLSSGRELKSTFIPDLYTKSLGDWVDSFYRQNGYLEYASLVRIGITDPKTFIKKKYKNESIFYLGTCCVGQAIIDQLEAHVDEALDSNTWVDVMPFLPSIFSMDDANQLLNEVAKTRKGVILCCDSIVTSENFVSDSSKLFSNLMAKKADHVAKTNPSLLTASSSSGKVDSKDSREDNKEQRRKKAAAGSGSTKSGGGLQGREIKTKSTKKKARAREADDHSDDDTEASASSKRKQAAELEFMSLTEIEDVLRKEKSFEDCPDEFLTEVATHLYRPLSNKFIETAKSIFLQSTGAASSSGRKKTHGELQEKIMGLWTNAKLFEKGIKMFHHEDAQENITRHLLRTICSDIANLIICSLATDQMLSVPEDCQLTPEMRLKVVSQLVDENRIVAAKLNTSLNGKSLGEFFNALDVLCGPSHCGIMLKKADKKKERHLTFNHRQGLLEQLKNETDPAMTLHIASVILFHTFTQNIITIPGKCVPHVIQFLKLHMEKDDHAELQKLQEMIVKHMKFKSDEESEEKGILTRQMDDMLQPIKDIAMNTKKPSPSTSKEEES